MRVTANQIVEWGNTRNAQAELPLLIRNLILATNSLSGISIPGGDSVYRPGWDGKINSLDTSAWVPSGNSVWEMGCNSKVKSKANDDFNKRTEQNSREFMLANSFIFVTPFRWHMKSDWLKEKNALNVWKSVHVIDADDLENWFEMAPAVAVQFAEQIGMAGFGMESIDTYWQNWSTQSRPAITAEAIQTGREYAKRSFLEHLEKQTSFLTIEADSKEEAVAFCCSVIQQHPLNRRAVCITDKIGWRFVDANDEIQVVLLGTQNLADLKAPKEGLTVVQPICHRDLAGIEVSRDTNISIPRIEPHKFKDAIVSLGEELNDARRLTSSSGRSWSVYRRFKSINPSIRKPPWLSGLDKDVLLVLLLLGAWRASSKGDVVLIETLTKRPYEEIEEILSELVLLDDSPVINIDNVWKAKSHVELLFQIAPRLTKSKLSRFLELTKSILSKPDPKLELEEDKRWMANIYGKVREESGVVIESILNSLIKIRVFAETTESSISSDVIFGIDSLIKDLLMDSDEKTWMSLATYLPYFAEASPDTFLSCIEKSLAMQDQPISCLINNTTGTAVGNQCWYSGLLWALEIIAWNSSKLSRVTTILIKLDEFPINSNWGNSPISTLESFYRVYWPQVLATSEQKIRILERIGQCNSAFAWKFMLSLIPDRGSYSLDNARPKWREDDAGSESEKGVYYPHYLCWIADKLFELAEGEPTRISVLFEKYSSFQGSYKQRLISLVESISRFDDVSKEIILTKLRRHISLSKSDDVDDKDKELDRLVRIYNDNQPTDLILRYRWLFASRWIDLPEGERRDYEKTDILRASYRGKALKHIVDKLGFKGVARLVDCVEDTNLLGIYLAKHQQENNYTKLTNFAFESYSHSPLREMFLNGVISQLAVFDQAKILELIRIRFKEDTFDVSQKVTVLMCLPKNKVVFHFIESLGSYLTLEFWKKVNIEHVEDVELFHFVLKKYGELRRYSNMFSLIIHDFSRVEPRIVLEILNGLLTEDTANIKRSIGYWVEKAIDYISASEKISQQELATLEFSYLAIIYKPNSIPRNLLNELLCSPEAFVQLVCFVYKAEGKCSPEKSIKYPDNIANNAWKILHNGRGVPGLSDANSVDEFIFNKWINDTRDLGRKRDRETMTDQSIGQLLSVCPNEDSDSWPSLPICKLLERDDAAEIRSGFIVGIKNNRGVVSRPYRGGGDLERSLASTFKDYAEKLQDSFVQTSLLLNKIADFYEYLGRIEDNEARIGDELD